MPRNNLDLANALLCLLFVSGEALKAEEIARALNIERKRVGEVASELEGRLQGTGLMLERLAQGYRLSTRPEYAEYVKRLRPPRRERLSRAALETLAIIAYRQPITRAEVERIRGVGSEGPLSTLLQHQLIRPVGRKKALGRPLMYGTTEKFLELFGLQDLSELPPLDQKEG